MVIPVSFIVINSIRVANEPYYDNSSDFWSALYMSTAASLGSVSSGMISELLYSTDCKPMKFNCRVSLGRSINSQVS